MTFYFSSFSPQQNHLIYVIAWTLPCQSKATFLCCNYIIGFFFGSKTRCGVLRNFLMILNLIEMLELHRIFQIKKKIRESSSLDIIIILPVTVVFGASRFIHSSCFSNHAVFQLQMMSFNTHLSSLY